MANNRSFDKNGVNERELEYKQSIRDGQKRCDHRNNQGPSVERVATSNRFIRDRHLYSDSCVICKECGEIFDITSHTKEEFKQAVMVITDMVNQIKLLGNPGDDDYAKLIEVLNFTDRALFEGIGPYYFHLVKQLSNGNGNGKNRKQDSNHKGKLGISSGQFASR